ncbi:non-homologous end-joining DNA ligase [Actinacidiphila sp. bgisy144]|uniref:non-homologous end-joining DNA ligase n=1 Tax=Actinacidiphila sp. bgisy144 TaxID=3413791 RepID=UPI003EB790DC
MSSETVLRAGGRTVRIGRADKPLFPDDGLTKADLARYYHAVAPRLLPHVRGRPLMLERHPDGIGSGSFMQKDVPQYFPDWVHRTTVPKEGGTVTHAVCDDTATLLYLAGQATITPHRWLSRADRPYCPDRLVFDLDPPEDDFVPVREAARLLRGLLDELRLPCAVMTTGSRGLHVLVPLDRRAHADDVLAFARDTADVLADRHPGELTTQPRKQARRGRLYLDVQRNGYAQTAVAPYAVRALAGAPLAMPLTWSEVDDPATTARRWTLDGIDERLAQPDPWKDPALTRGRSLAAARRRLDRLRD